MPQLEDLKLSVESAEAIIEKGIEYGAYSDEMPDTKKEKLAAADEIVSFSIDAYVNDGITSDDDDPAVAESGRQIEEIMDLAGVAIEDGEPVFGEAPEPEGADDDDNGGDGESEEAPFDPDDYIEGYSELSVVTKLKKVKELDTEAADDVAILNALYDWENEQEKPSSRILNYIDEALGEPEAEGDDSNGDDPEAEEDSAEPWSEQGDPKSEDYLKAYDESSATEIKNVLNGAMESGDLTREQVEYVLEYEEGREKPPTRKRVVEFCKALLDDFDNGGDDPEPEPEAPKRGRARVKAEPVASSNGVIVLTREQILTALDSGEVTIEL